VIVDGDHLEILEGLGLNGVQALAQGGFGVAEG
jgi:hypothetical protein